MSEDERKALAERVAAEVATELRKQHAGDLNGGARTSDRAIKPMVLLGVPAVIGLVSWALLTISTIKTDFAEFRGRVEATLTGIARDIDDAGSERKAMEKRFNDRMRDRPYPPPGR